MKVIKEDRFFWEDEQIGGIQTKCQLLLCWFHTKRIWVQHLLPKVPEEQRNDLYKLMCNMLEAVTEDDFNEAYQRLRINYQGHPGVLQYVEKGWAGQNSPWKQLWPRWGRMFPHGHANTTNLIERMWQYVKYTLLGGKVNCRLEDLILAIIGNPETGQQFRGGTLVDHYDRAHWLSESGKYVRRGGDKSRTTKLQRARWLVSR